MSTEQPDDDPLNHMTELEAEQMARAEFKYIPRPVEQHRYSDFPFLHREHIIGTYFSAYENDPARCQDELHVTPILLHSEKNRFARMCDIAMRNWIPELPEVLAALITLEDDLARDGEIDQDHAWQGMSFGLEATPDTYIIGYTGTTSNIVARKELLANFLGFAVRSLARLPHGRGPTYDMETAMSQAEKLVRLVLPTEE